MPAAPEVNAPPADDEPAFGAWDDDLNFDDPGDEPVIPRGTPGRAAAHRVQATGVVVVVGGKGGGVGKTTTVAHMAERCAARGLRTIAIDDRSQGDLRRRLGFGKDRTMLQVAQNWDGRPETLGEWIVRDEGLEADYIVGPDTGKEDYDEALIPNELFGRVVDVLLGMYDVVFVDTSPAKMAKATEPFFTTWIPRLVDDPRHATVVVSEWDRAKLVNALEWSAALLTGRVDPSRVFFLAIRPAVEDAKMSVDRVLSRFTVSRVLQPFPYSQRVINGNSDVSKPVDGLNDPAYLAALDAALYEILGDSRFLDHTPQRRSWWKRKGGAK